MPTATAPAVAPRERALMTRDGYDALRRELEHLNSARRSEIADRLREARADEAYPTENSGLMEALHDSAELERRVVAIESLLAAARIAEPGPADGTATVGSRVRLRDGRAGNLEYELVGTGEADPARRRVSIDSPIGRAIAGRRAGDRVEVDAPAGRIRFELVEVSPRSHGRRAARAAARAAR